VLCVGRHVYLVEWKASGDVAGVAAGVRLLDRNSNRNRNPRQSNQGALLAVPYMGDAAPHLSNSLVLSFCL